MKKDIGSCLFMVGVPAAIIAVVVAWICDSFFPLSDVGLALVVLGVFGLVAAAFVLGLLHRHSKAQEVIQSTVHPYFGRVDLSRSGWRARLDVPGLGGELQVVSPEGGEPTGAQIETAQWIHANGSEIAGSIESWFENLSDVVEQRLTPPFLMVRSIDLDPKVPKKFRITFNYENRQACGFTGAFENERLLEVV